MNAMLNRAAGAGTSTAQRHCQHHWLIEVANGARSRAVCRRCQQVRRFHNCIDDVTLRDVSASSRPMRHFAMTRNAETGL
jgi:hypothetical protein